MCTDNWQGTHRLEELLTGIKEKREVMELVYDWAERSGINVNKDVRILIEDAKNFKKEVEDGYLKELQDRLQDLLADIDEYLKIEKEMPAQEGAGARESAYVLALQEKAEKCAEVLWAGRYAFDIFYMEAVYGPEPSFEILDVGSSPFS